MAAKPNTPALRQAQPKGKSARPTTSRRTVDIHINKDEIDFPNRLHHLMVIQRKTGCGFETVYRASESNFVRAGLPRVVMQQPTSRTGYAFRLNDHYAFLGRRGDLFELVLQWDDLGPWYHSEAHPALAETARMIRIWAGHWLRDLTISFNSPERGLVQTDKLLNEGCDYYQPRERKYRFNPEELQMFEHHLQTLARAVEMGDVYLVEPAVLPKPRKPRRPSPAKVAQIAESAKKDGALQSFLSGVAHKVEKRARRTGSM
jgi:hypothetical protein